MKAFVLAAGLGTRLRPLTLTTPKALVLVQGVPLIFYALALLKSQGITEIIINIHHLGHLIKKTLGDGAPFGLNITYSKETELLGTGGGLAKVLPELSEEFWMINSDVIVDCPLDRPELNQALATLLVRPLPKDATHSLITIQNDTIESILNEPPGLDGTKTHFTGVHFLSKLKLQNFLKHRNLGPRFCIVKDVYQPYLKSHPTGLKARLHSGFWEDGGTHLALEQIENLKLDLSYKTELHVMNKIYKAL